jgi:TolA-binding protein
MVRRVTTPRRTPIRDVLDRLRSSWEKPDIPDQRVSHEDLMKVAKNTAAGVHALLHYIPGIIDHLNSLGDRMSELDQSVEGLQSAVADLADRIGDTPQQLEDALRQIADLNSQIADLSGDDEADAARIESLTQERDDLVSDAQENVARLKDVTEQIGTLAGGGSGGDTAGGGEPPVPDNTLPSGGDANTGGDHVDNTLPGDLEGGDTTPPTEGGDPYPDNSLPTDQPHPDNSLPTDQPHPDIDGPGDQPVVNPLGRG